jgi:hypothetical protein
LPSRGDGDALDHHALLTAFPFNLAIISICKLKMRISRVARKTEASAPGTV